MKKTLAVYSWPHPVHLAYGESINADYYKIQQGITKNSGAIDKMTVLIRNALSIPGSYEIILSETCYYYPALKRVMGGLKAKIININASAPFFNIISGRANFVDQKVLLFLLKQVDAHMVFGTYGVETIRKLEAKKPVGKIYPYISDSTYSELTSIKPNLDSKEFTIIGNSDPYYKGMDILIHAFNRVIEKDNKVKLNIITNMKEEQVLKFDIKKSGRIRFLGRVPSISPTLAKSCLYIHPGRGDCFPVASLEAMAAGIPTIVSEETGTKEVVREVSPELVCKLDPENLANRMIRYLEMSKNEKKEISGLCRESVKKFNKKEQVENFKIQFNRLVDQLF